MNEEVEDEDEEELLFDDENDIPFEETEKEEGLGSRIALNKMDWESISSIDLMALFGSLCTGDKVVHKV